MIVLFFNFFKSHMILSQEFEKALIVRRDDFKITKN